MWLPELVSFNGDWERYLELLYSYYSADFIYNKPNFNGKHVNRFAKPLFKGKEETFWHIIQKKDKNSGDRIPDIRRCERIRWPKSIIENTKENCIKIWNNERKTKKGIQKNIVIFFEEQNYVIILRDRKYYYVLCTAYPVGRISKKKLLNEYKKTGDAE